ncbi:hypothetical protein ABZ876_34660 [Streptomyces sp. NPDC046931]|uniref:hypothetical protein n=1 Tax=Streptomyces sp. NPDC046931 TaxID=3154806 RepID=UPI0033EC4E3E
MADARGDYEASKQYAEHQEKERKEEHKKDHDRLIESDKVAHQGQGGRPTGLKTDFMSYSINGLRQMILDSHPGKIAEVGGHWKKVHEILSGGDGDGKTGGVDTQSAKGSIAGLLQTAVDNVLEHWEGQAADAFRRKADHIGVQIRNGSAHANFMAEQLLAISKDLDASKAKMEEIKEPSLAERASDKLNDDGRDDSQMRKDLAAGVSADTAAKANEKNLSLTKERQLQAVAVMEELAANYKVYSQNLKNAKPINDREGVEPPNNNVTMPPPVSPPVASGGGPGAARGGNKPWSAGPTTSIKPAPTAPSNRGISGGLPAPRDGGIHGGSQLPTAKTKVDDIAPLPTPGTGPGTRGFGDGGGGGGIRAAGTQTPDILSTGGASSLPRGGLGLPGGRSGLAGGGTAAGRGAGGRSGMGGMGAGGGAAGRGGAGLGGRGALARARGGVIGAAKGATKGAGGGAGLHGSRGGTQRGAMAGGMGGRNGRRSEEENSRGERPDYLVEDEETWISEEDRNRNVPRTIE